MFSSFLQNGIVLIKTDIVMDALVFLLHEIDTSNLPDEKNKILQAYEHSAVPLIHNQAAGLLITSEGNPDFDRIDELHSLHGYFVFPGERDRFGWVTACIQTKKGIIVFG